MPKQKSLSHWSVAGRAALLKSDPVLAGIISKTELPPITPEPAPDLYAALLRAVMGQQLSVKAAATIWKRFWERFAEGEILKPETVLGATDEDLREVGVSRQKAGYARAVSEFAKAGHLRFEEVEQMNAETFTAHLTQIKGVGQWTAEMIQIFALDRPDVFSPGDLGIQNAMRRAYGLTGTGKPFLQRITALAESWKPYRSLACRYLWRSLDGSD